MNIPCVMCILYILMRNDETPKASVSRVGSTVQLYDD
jgi:hypothetical protein